MTTRVKSFIRVFHRTTDASAERILRDGFVNGRGTYLTANEYEGVWLSDVPLGVNEGLNYGLNDSEGTLLTMRVPVELFEQYEWVETAKSYREALVPAEAVNALGRPRIVSVAVEDRFEYWRWQRRKQKTESPLGSTVTSRSAL